MKVAKDAFYLERTNMVRNQLIPNQIYDSRILDAMESIPRHIFVEEKWRPVAYVDENIPACVGRASFFRRFYLQRCCLAVI